MRDLVVIGAGPVGLDASETCTRIGAARRVAWVVDPADAARKEARALHCGVRFAEAPDQLPDAGGDDVALVAFSSRADATVPVAQTLLGKGYHVVTSCEELSDPAGAWRAELGALCRATGRTLAATGANPGFVMDVWPLQVAAGAVDIGAVIVTRRVDTSRRRAPLVAKTGRGLEQQDFRSRAAAGEVGHVGLGVSTRLLADGLGWPIDAVAETIEPVVEGDLVAGLHQRAEAAAGDRRIELDLTMSWGLAAPVDRVTVVGSPPLSVEIQGGYHGDRGTTARLAHAIGVVGRLEPALYLPTQLPLAQGT